MKEGTAKILAAVIVALAATLLVFLLSRTVGSETDAPSPTTLTYMIGTLILVGAGNWAVLRRVSLSMYVRSLAIWVVVAAAAYGLYVLLYPGGG